MRLQSKIMIETFRSVWIVYLTLMLYKIGIDFKDWNLYAIMFPMCLLVELSKFVAIAEHDFNIER